MKRRTFIKHSAAVASLTAVNALPLASASTNTNAVTQCLKFIVLADSRFSDSRRFAAELEARGARVVTLDEDIGVLWRGALRDHCIAADAVIAGMTLHTDLFISREFAREMGRKLIHFGVHDCRGQRTLRHTLPGSSQLDLRECEAWPEEVASAMLALSPPLPRWKRDGERVTKLSGFMKAHPPLPSPLPQRERGQSVAPSPSRGEGWGEGVESKIVRSPDHPGSLYSWLIA